MNQSPSGPLYAQLEQDLRARIRTGEFKPGDALPTEEQIGNAYGVSRITVRRAIEALAQDLIVVRRHGVGTFVAAADQVLQSIRMRGYLEDVLALDRHLQFEPVKLGHAVPTGPVAAAFRRTFDQPSPYAEVVAALDGLPFMYAECYFAPDRVRQLRAEDFSGREQPTLKVMTRAGILLEKGEQIIAAAIAPNKVAGRLNISRGTPVLEVLRIYIAAGGEVAAVIRGHYHPSNYRMSADLFPRAVSGGRNRLGRGQNRRKR